MSAQPPTVIEREAASRALIDLIADLAWAERTARGRSTLRLARQEAMGLLPLIESGDREATRRAMEIVHAAGRSAG